MTDAVDKRNVHAVFGPKRGPFSLDDDQAYSIWRHNKLAAYPESLEDMLVEIANPSCLTAHERAKITQVCQRANMAFYHFGAGTDDERRTRMDLLAFGSAIGLTAMEDHRSAEADGVVRIEVVSSGGRLGYIPYTDKPIKWHTDGYYNYHGPERSVRAMLLHCHRNAVEGGINRLLDHHIAYIRLRDANAGHIAALMHPAAMTIPASVEENGRIRAENTGPVFYVDPRNGALGMRYTARRRNIVWRDDVATRQAVALLERLLETDPLVIRAQLGPGQGVVCNNVLHDRSGFVAGDAPEQARLLFRIRYGGLVAAPVSLPST